MKQNIAKVFTFSLLASSISFISCVDNEKNLFDADQLKQIYEETFQAAFEVAGVESSIRSLVRSKSLIT